MAPTADDVAAEAPAKRPRCSSRFVATFHIEKGSAAERCVEMPQLPAPRYQSGSHPAGRLAAHPSVASTATPKTSPVERTPLRSGPAWRPWMPPRSAYATPPGGPKPGARQCTGYFAPPSITRAGWRAISGGGRFCTCGVESCGVRTSPDQRKHLRELHGHADASTWDWCTFFRLFVGLDARLRERNRT